ncbi:hypothetical protein Q0590_16350 [Rhodocytophaga aerolata]|uniref:DUF1735 domain-containing protein n=1 Tax=Rhodocytophaga aerolata TaxID=455078 RepID=A0ABT8R7B3_9BACT|nr:hypothetical protein [Rhodocytophaga aerolata]MDO1447844.1 hypothetical protein [Rhodocytophaga aerolata]
MYKHPVFFKVVAYSLICLVGSVSWVACKKVENLLTFRIKNEVSFMIPSAIGINTPYSFPTPDVPTNASQSFSNNNTNVNKVKDIKLETLNLTITSPSNATFKPVKSINIYIVSEGLPKKLIAYKNDIPTTVGNQLTLETTRENLDSYVKKESYSLATETVLREAVFQDTEIHAQMSFLVSADF